VKNIDQESAAVQKISTNLLELTPEEQDEYNNKIEPIPIQSAVNQLRRLLVHDGPRVHKTQAHRLSIQDNPEPYSKFRYSKTRIILPGRPGMVNIFLELNCLTIQFVNSCTTKFLTIFLQ